MTLSIGDKPLPKVANEDQSRQDNTSNNGFVLFTVIWLVAAIAVLTTMFVTRTQNAKILERALSFNRELEMAADGLARLQAFNLVQHVNDPQTHQMDLRGKASGCKWNEKLQLTFAVQDQGGLLDINTSSPDLMAAVFMGFGVKRQEVSVLLDAMLDYRDPDATTKDGRPERELYSEAGPTSSNQSFQAIEELDRIPGISDDLFAKLMKLTTVHSQQPGIDTTTAPEEMTKLLSDPRGELPPKFQSPSPKRVFAVTAKAVRKSGGHFTRHALIAITGQPDRPFAILKWAKRDRDFLDDAAPTSKPCFVVAP